MGINGTVYYSLEDHTDKFNIDTTTGEIQTASRLLAEADTLYRLTVVAHDRGMPSKSSTGFVEVRTSSSQMASLLFENSTYTVYLSEHAPVDSVIVKVKASRTSGLSSPGVQYSFASGNEEGIFKIDSDTGVVAVGKSEKLDYETKPRLRLIVIAQADGGRSTSIYGYATVWINLRDINDHTPVFSQEKYSSATWEGVPPGRYVVQVQATDSDGSSRNSQIEYHIVDGNYDDAFTIKPSFSGIVKTNIKLDRETYPSYRLTIRAVDSGSPSRSSTAVLRITVVDVNDNEPRFPPPQIVDVPESRPVGTVIATVTATDVDISTGTNSRGAGRGSSGSSGITYFFPESGNANGMFAIDETSGAVMLAKTMDYERKQEYLLTVKASDTQHEARTTLTVKVKDENDNAPVFRQQSYSTTLPEKTVAGYRVIQVSAEDADSGVNAEIRYSMGVTPVEGFYIDSKTGVIFTNASIEYDPLNPTIQLVITAQDSGPPPGLAAVTAVKIHVTDASNKAPRFKEHIYTAEVGEDAEKGTVVAEVEALYVVRQRDWRNLDYRIISGNEDREFRIISGSSSVAEIISIRSLDRETSSAYNLRIQALDRTAPMKRNATAEVLITVRDVNDNSPLFVKSLYEASVKENQPPETEVVRVSAKDPDAGANARVRYDITSGNDADTFAIDTITGVVSIATALDADVKNKFQFIVRASDDALPPEKRLSAFATVIVNVGDVNDNKPTFPVLMYLESVEENAPVGTVVFTAHANDLDAGPFGRLTYSITEGSGKALFAINSRTGEVTTTAVFDYEAETSYRLKIMAVDGHNWDIVQAQVTILSVDEYEPKFDRQSYEPPPFPSTAPRGTVVGKVSASDSDEGEDGVIIFTIRTKQDNIRINITSGELVIVKPFVKNNEAENRRRRSSDKDWRRSSVLKEDKAVLDEASPRQTRETGATEDPVMLLIQASSGKESSKSDVSIVKLNVDYTCPGCALIPTRNWNGNGGGSSYDNVIQPTVIVIVVLVVLALILVIVIVALRIRTKRKGARQAGLGAPRGMVRQPGDGRPPTVGGNNPIMAGGAMGGHAPFMAGFGNSSVHDHVPPPYLGIHAYGANILGPGFSDLPAFGHPRANLSTSEISEVSRGSATSSGRGSAEDDEIDRICRQGEGGTGHETTRSREERMRLVREHMQDSGVHPGRDADGASMSDTSSSSLGRNGVRSTEEYLARLGISPSRQKALAAAGHARSVESMHAFSDEGGGEGLDLQADMDHLVYAKIPDLESIHNGSARGSLIHSLAPPRTGGEDLASILGSSCATPSMSIHGGRGATTASIGSHLDRHGGSGAASTVPGSKSEDDLVGGIAYNWDYLLDWTPSYLPLAPVFSEIAKLKEYDDDDDEEDEEEEPQGQRNSINSRQVPQQLGRPSSWQTVMSVPTVFSVSGAPTSSDNSRPPPILTGAAPRIPPPPSINMASHPLNTHVQLLPHPSGGGGPHRHMTSALHRHPHLSGNMYLPQRGTGGSQSPLSIESVYSSPGFSATASMAALSAPQSPSPLLTPATPSAQTPRAPSATSMTSRSSSRSKKRHRRSGGHHPQTHQQYPNNRRDSSGSDSEIRI